MREARRRRQHTGPRLRSRIQAADDQERQLGEEVPMLVGHVVAQHARAEGLHPLAHAGARLHGALALVPGGRGRVHATSPMREAAIGTKPGSASIRASQARTCG